VVFRGREHLVAEVLRSFVLELLVNPGLSRRPQTLPIETRLGPIAEHAGVAPPVLFVLADIPAAAQLCRLPQRMAAAAGPSAGLI
jgi:hypothetical protein